MIKKGVFIILGVYVLLLIGIYFFQEKIIFRSKTLPKNYSYTFDKKFEEINLSTSDKSIINALHFKVDNPKGVILYFHGNKGSLERWGKKITPLLDYGYDLFVIDYRGYGKSTGRRVEEKMYKDAQLSYDYLLKTYKEHEIVVYGRSLGGTFATYVASKNNPKHLLLEASFSSVTDVAHSTIPIFPFEKLFRFKFKSYKIIENVKIPTTIFHGNNDALVSLKIAKKLYNYSNKTNTEFIEIDKGTHHNLGEFNIYKEKLKIILK